MQGQLAPSIRRYLSACEARGLAAATITSRRYHLAGLAALVDKSPELVDDDDVEDYLLASGHLAANTRRVRRETLSAYFSWMVRRGKLTANPVDLVDKLRITRAEPTYYTPEQAARLVGACTDPRDRLLVVLLLRHGQRVSSVYSLPWAAVDLGRAVVTYPPTKGGPALPLALDLDAAKQLKAWRALVTGPWVFPGYKGTHISYQTARTCLQRACKAAGLPYRGAHEFRRTCVTTLLQMGTPLHVVSKRVAGHSNVSTTVKFYAGIEDESVASAIRRLPY